MTNPWRKKSNVAERLTAVHQVQPLKAFADRNERTCPKSCRCWTTTSRQRSDKHRYEEGAERGEGGANSARLGKATRVRSEKKDARWWTISETTEAVRGTRGGRGQRRGRERVERGKRRFAVGCGKRQWINRREQCKLGPTPTKIPRWSSTLFHPHLPAASRPSRKASLKSLMPATAGHRPPTRSFRLRHQRSSSALSMTAVLTEKKTPSSRRSFPRNFSFDAGWFLRFGHSATVPIDGTSLDRAVFPRSLSTDRGCGWSGEILAATVSGNRNSE